MTIRTRQQLLDAITPLVPLSWDHGDLIDLIDSLILRSERGGAAIYGDASAGDVVISVDTELSTSLYSDDLTIDAGITLNTNGWPVYVRGTLTNNGTITGSTDATRRGGDGVDGGIGATVTAAYIFFEGYGGNGGNGADGEIDTDFIYAGGLGGRWGGAGGGAGAFAGGVVNGAVDADGHRVLQRSSLGGGAIDIFGAPRRIPYIGGQGGGGGAGDTSVGGGGALGGSVVLIAARAVVNNATINAPGGAGGDGDPAGNAGGGGGGQGGLIILIYDAWTGDKPTAVDVPGGAGGAGAGTGAAGATGEAGLVLDIPNV